MSAQRYIRVWTESSPVPGSLNWRQGHTLRCCVTSDLDTLLQGMDQTTFTGAVYAATLVPNEDIAAALERLAAEDQGARQARERAADEAEFERLRKKLGK